MSGSHPAVIRTGREQRDALREKWRADGWYPGVTVAEALTASAARFADSELVFASGEGRLTVTLGEIHARATALAAGLGSVGLRAGDAVIVQAPADPESTVALEALWLVGCVVIPLAATLGPVELTPIVEQSRARAIVVPSSWRGVDFAARAIELSRSTELELVLVLGDEAPDGGVALHPLESRHGPAPDPSTRTTEVCCVVYTSGSTAAPKGVQHSHDTLLCGLVPPPGAEALAPGRSLSPFPAGHVASVLGLLRPLVAGGTTVIMDRWSPSVAATLIAEHQIDTSAGTPFFLASLLDEAERSGTDISSLVRFLVGAASVPPSLVERAEAAGISSWRTYGSTEHPLISSGSPDHPTTKRVNTDGMPSPGNEVRLVDEHGRDVRNGGEGEIVSRGPRQFVGYRDESLDDDAFLDSTWFRTGDVARFDDDGFLVVTDRLKDIIIRGGENISAREVEDLLASHPSVKEVAVCAGPDPVWGERVCAFVIAEDGEPPALDELVAYVLEAGLARHKVPAQLEIVETLPRTEAGKVRKLDLRDTLRRAGAKPT